MGIGKKTSNGCWLLIHCIFGHWGRFLFYATVLVATLKLSSLRSTLIQEKEPRQTNQLVLEIMICDFMKAGRILGRVTGTAAFISFADCFVKRERKKNYKILKNQKSELMGFTLFFCREEENLP